jgi:hypothetical protein
MGKRKKITKTTTGWRGGVREDVDGLLAVFVVPERRLVLVAWRACIKWKQMIKFSR